MQFNRDDIQKILAIRFSPQQRDILAAIFGCCSYREMQSATILNPTGIILDDLIVQLYPDPDDEPEHIATLLKVVVCRINKRLRDLGFNIFSQQRFFRIDRFKYVMVNGSMKVKMNDDILIFKGNLTKKQMGLPPKQESFVKYRLREFSRDRY